VAARRVLLDTNVCYPISLLDLFLRLDEVSLHEVLWTEDLLEELMDTWVKHGVRTREAAERVYHHIRAAFAGQDVPRSEYEALIDKMPGNDPDDHRHAAAAAAQAPAIILTENLRDFPAEPLDALGVSVRRPDDYLNERLDRHRDEIVEVITMMAADRRRPAMSLATCSMPLSVLASLASSSVSAPFARPRLEEAPSEPWRCELGGSRCRRRASETCSPESRRRALPRPGFRWPSTGVD
jgi:hypothetical protein